MHKTQVYLVFDERMALHRPIWDCDNPDYQPVENPERVFKIYGKLLDLEKRLSRERDCYSGIMPHHQQRFVEFPCKPVEKDTILLAHTEAHYENVFNTMFMSDHALKQLADPDDIYYCQSTFLAASLACGGVVQCVNAVTSHDLVSKITRAIAIVRPPGHHAENDEAMGFCFFNNIAVAAKHALHTERAKRVFILDWDIHHGNGIQNITYDDPNIFYASIHRACFDSKNWFYPGTGRPTEVGGGEGLGSNLNIAWGKGGMGNSEYAAAFAELILPAMGAFQPDLILVACGLDAAKGDSLGDCGLSPDMFYIMTKSVLDQAGADIPIVMVLEGGYNIDVSAECMENVALGLLDEPCHEGQYYDLSKYWTSSNYEELGNQNKVGRRNKTDTAVMSIKRSAKALAASDESSYFATSSQRNADASTLPPVYHGAFGPLKKRRQPEENDAEMDVETFSQAGPCAA